jgi:hypothetical protein
MRAENQTGTPETVELIKNRLVGFAEAALFESPEYRAASDSYGSLAPRRVLVTTCEEKLIFYSFITFLIHASHKAEVKWK